MTVFRSSHARLNGGAPLLLTAYGAYGECLDEDFRLERLPLLRRGWALAFAHVRGGGEQGRRCVSCCSGSAGGCTYDDSSPAGDSRCMRCWA